MFLCGCEEKPEPDPQGSEEAPTTLLVGTAVGTALLFVALMYLAYTVGIIVIACGGVETEFGH